MEVEESPQHHAGKLRAKSPQKNLSPYLSASSPQASAAGKLSPKSKGSNHINTMKSLGLLHDLQDYITSVEALTTEQRNELDRLREEKREVERTVYKMEIQGDRGGPLNDFFRSSEIAELPPKLRAVFEENKMVREKLRKHTGRIKQLEQQVSQKNTQIVYLEDNLAVLKQQLAACSRTPADVQREESLKDQLYVKDRRVATLEHELSVLRSKLETDAKLHRQSLAGAKREQESLKKQIVLANANLEEQDKELRAARLEIRRLNRFLAPSRGSPSRPFYVPPAEEGSGDMVAMPPSVESSQGGALSLAPAPADPPVPHVHLMLCVIHSQDSTPTHTITLAPTEPVSQPYQVAEELQAEVPPQQQAEVPAEAAAEQPQHDAGEPATDPPPMNVDSAVDKITSAFRLLHPPDADAGGEQVPAAEAVAEQSAEPEQPAPVEQQQTVEAAAVHEPAEDAAPLEAHASAPRPVPYSRTQARAESKKGGSADKAAAAATGSGSISKRGSKQQPGSGQLSRSESQNISKRASKTGSEGKLSTRTSEAQKKPTDATPAGASNPQELFASSRQASLALRPTGAGSKRSSHTGGVAAVDLSDALTEAVAAMPPVAEVPEESILSPGSGADFASREASQVAGVDVSRLPSAYTVMTDAEHLQDAEAPEEAGAEQPAEAAHGSEDAEGGQAAEEAAVEEAGAPAGADQSGEGVGGVQHGGEGSPLREEATFAHGDGGEEAGEPSSETSSPPAAAGEPTTSEEHMTAGDAEAPGVAKEPTATEEAQGEPDAAEDGGDVADTPVDGAQDELEAHPESHGGEADAAAEAEEQTGSGEAATAEHEDAEATEAEAQVSEGQGDGEGEVAAQAVEEQPVKEPATEAGLAGEEQPVQEPATEADPAGEEQPVEEPATEAGPAEEEQPVEEPATEAGPAGEGGDE